MANDTFKPEVVSQEGALIGDDQQAPATEPTVNVVNADVDAQVSPPRGPDAGTARVHEVRVQLDHPVLDPSSPEAVQVPDAGRGDLTLGAHRLSQPSPEQVFASAKPAKK